MSGETASLDILYQDEDILVVHKPSGLLTHRGWGRDRVTLADLAREHLGQPIHLLHRLDRATSGVILIATAADSARRWSALFSQRKIRKHYVALVRGVSPEQGLIDHPIPRDQGGPRVPAQTAFRRLAQGPHRSIVEAVPLTGRLHQLRRHLRHINHHIIGDRKRGDGRQNRLHQENFDLQRMALHAWRLSFSHPDTGQHCTFEAPLPDDLLLPFSRMELTPTAWQQKLLDTEDWLSPLLPPEAAP